MLQVEMMSVTEHFPYYEDEDVKVLGLPYTGDEVLMYIILPQQKFGLSDVMKKLTGRQLLDYTERCKDMGEVEVSNLYSD